MKIPTRFSGRIVQVCEALSYQDAVSEHVLALHRLLSQMGIRSEVYAKWHDARVEHLRKPLEEMQLTEADVAVLHFCGRSEHALPAVLDSYCTRVMQYHNITPAEFFDPNSRLHGFCVEGRQQLAASIGRFHHVWADSAFNLQELLDLGAPADRANVVPIVVEPPATTDATPIRRTPGTWLFIGRIAPNKAQVELVRLFARAHRQAPWCAQGLILAGAYEEGDPYYEALLRAVDEERIGNHIRIAGKVDDSERERLYRTASVYVSLSAHEGFGVPLIEASLRGQPVVALASSAVPDTLGHGAGLAADLDDVVALVQRLHDDGLFREDLLRQQRANAGRFAPGSVQAALLRAMNGLLPRPGEYRTVSVVICTYNRRDYLERVLDYLHHQRHPGFEVVVVDGPSTDGSKELLQQQQHRIKLAHNPERNLSKSRNLGIELCDGDVVAFIDDDALPFDDWILRVLEAYNRRPLTVAGLGGPAYYAGTFWFQAEDNGINCHAEALVNIASNRIGRDGWYRYNTGTNATFSRRHLVAHGGFDEQFDYFLDESEVCFRLQKAGLLIGYEPDVVVRHEFAQSHNRQGRLNFNWFTICKNTAYFIAAYSGLQGSALQELVRRRLETDRLESFDKLLEEGHISASDHQRYRDGVLGGMEQGLADARAYPRRRPLLPPPGAFHPFPVSHDPVLNEPRLRQLHVVIISREFPPFAAGGGVGTLYYHLASELLMMGHRVTAIVPSGEHSEFRQGRMRVCFTPHGTVSNTGLNDGLARNMGWSIAAMSRLADLHGRDPVDVVDSALWDTEALATALLPARSRPKVVVRLVTPYALAADINGWNPPAEVSAQFMAAERALIAAADAVVPISESIASSVETTYGLHRDARWHTIPCGVAYWPFFDVNQGYNEFPQLAALPEAALNHGRIVLFVGRLERRKGVDLILQAAPTILAADPNVHIVLAGRDVEGWSGRPEMRALEGRVHLVGEVDNSTRDKLLARAWCLLFPSRYESFGLVPLEGFVHGVPVVAARAGAIPEVVGHDVSGLLFDSESAEAMAAACASIVADPALRERLSQGARRRVRELGSRPSAIRSAHLYSLLLS